MGAGKLYHILAPLVIILMLVGCAPPAPSPTFTPIFDNNGTALPFNEETCDRGALENWLQRSGSLLFEFSEVVNSNLAVPPQQADAILDQLSGLHGTLLRVPAPLCAAEHRELIDQAMLFVVETYTSYYTGHLVDLAAFVVEANARFDAARTRELELTQIYRSLP